MNIAKNSTHQNISIQNEYYDVVLAYDGAVALLL